MGRKTTCNELILAETREEVIELFTQSNTIYAEIAEITGVPIAKVKHMTAGMERPIRSAPLSPEEHTRLLLKW